MNNNIMYLAGLGDQVDNVKRGLCPTCGKTVRKEDFKDSLSLREFEISGMCQECQDETFNGPGVA